MRTKRAFSFVELIIVVSIITLLSVIVFNFSNSSKQKKVNANVKSSLATIENSMNSYLQDKSILPLPQGNLNFFSYSGVYVHDDFINGESSNTGTYGFYGKITENTLPKSFLDITPIDPRTGEYYSYGILKDKTQFEIAAVVSKKNDTDSFEAVVNGNYKAEEGIYNLIREYNGSQFVEDRKSHLPYNPYERKLVATDETGKVYVVGDEVKSGASGYKYLYFSDGSVTRLEPNTVLVLTSLDFPKENKLISKIKLNLKAGAVWTKATKLVGDGETDDDSMFQISAGDTTAAVRGTIFKMKDNGDVKVLDGKVKILVNGGAESTITPNLANREVLLGEISDWKNTDIKERLSTIEYSKKSLKESKDKQEKDIQKNNPNSYCYFDGEKIEDGDTIDGFKLKGEGTKENEGCDSKKILCKKGKLYQKTPESSENFVYDYDNLNYDKGYKHRECCIYIDYENNGNCEKGDKELIKEGYELVAYAPYDKTNDLNMYYKSGSFDMFHQGIIFSGPNSQEVSMNGLCPGSETSYSDSFCETFEGIKGIFIDNDDSSDDYLEYDIAPLDLGDNWAIEMKFRMPDITAIQYLFDFNNSLKAYFFESMSGKKLRVKNSDNILKKGISDIGLTEGKFYTIIVKKDGNDYEVKINNNVIYTSSNNKAVDNLLYIGSKKDNSKQLNDIIDYVKIYKKRVTY